MLVPHPPADDGSRAGHTGPRHSRPARSRRAPARPRAQPPAAAILREGARSGRLVHTERVPAAEGRRAEWPPWAPAAVTEAYLRAGAPAPWAHQAAAAESAWAGDNVIISTPAASGKSLGYLLPSLTAALAGGTALYIAPTKALAADQLRAVRALGIAGLRAATLDGDTPAGDRSWARSHAAYVLTTPDMLHHTILPQHARWRGFFGRLQYVIVDECHGYRGVFGAHVAQVLRRVQRVARHHGGGHPARRSAAAGADAPAGDPAPGPAFLLASATVAAPAECALLLTGQPATAVTVSAAPRAPLTLGLWEPPVTTGPTGAPDRRPATAEAASLLADLVRREVPALAFARSRRGAEAICLGARRALSDSGAPHLAAKVAAYRSGYLAQERRRLERSLRTGVVTGLAATTALELGVDISGLDAVLVAGWPGSRAALWQQAGRAGRAGREAVAILIARDDPLDTYLVHHPEALVGQPVEATVLDPANPHVLGPHLCAAAAELPLTGPDLALFGDGAPGVAAGLVQRGVLRRRGEVLHWARRGRPADISLRGGGSRPVKIVESGTGRLIGTVDEPSAHLLAHPGAVYPHQGDMHVVAELDLAQGVALVEARDPGYTTSTRVVTQVEVTRRRRWADWGDAAVNFGDVRVTRQVTAFLRRSPDTGRLWGETPLDLPRRSLRTRAVWWTVSAGQRAGLAARGVDLDGAAHAAEHTAIGLLPLFASCDRGDVGGLSASLHPGTGKLTVFVYDGSEGGAGFADKGFQKARDWLRATADAIAECGCGAGCPSCVQSPSCGSGNDPLSKSGASLLLECLLEGAAARLRSPAAGRA